MITLFRRMPESRGYAIQMWICDYINKKLLMVERVPQLDDERG
jgi:hypothetical protein